MSNLRAELKAELEAEGLFAYHPGRVYAKFFGLLAVALGFFVAALAAPSLWLAAPLFLAGVCTSIALVMIGHDAGHGAVSRHKGVNDLLAYLAFPVIGGMSLTYWKCKHNTLHHSYPNVDGKDPDVKIYPFAIHAGQRATSGWKTLLQRYQGLAFWPLTVFTVVAMRFDGIVFLVTGGRRLVPTRDRRFDILSVVLHHVLWLVVPTAVFGVPFLHALLFYALWSGPAGVLLAAIFLPAHMVLPMFRTYDENFVLQLQTTQNLRTNPLFSFLLVGLDHQVEHHLFQRMSHLSVKRAAPLVKAFCERKGLPYHEQGWGAAIWDSTRQLDRMPHLELTDRPPRTGLVGLPLTPVERGAAEFSDGREPVDQAMGA